MKCLSAYSTILLITSLPLLLASTSTSTTVSLIHTQNVTDIEIISSHSPNSTEQLQDTHDSSTLNFSDVSIISEVPNDQDISSPMTHEDIEPPSFPYNLKDRDKNSDSADSYSADPNLTSLCDLSLEILYLQDLTHSMVDVAKTLPPFLSVVDSRLKDRYIETNFGVASFKDKPIQTLGASEDFCFQLDYPMTPASLSDRFIQSIKDRKDNSTNSANIATQLNSTTPNVDSLPVRQPTINNNTTQHTLDDLFVASGGGDWLDNQFGAMIRGSIAGSFTTVGRLSQHNHPILRLLLVSTDSLPHLDGDVRKVVQSKRARRGTASKTPELRSATAVGPYARLESTTVPVPPFDSVITQEVELKENSNLGCGASEYPSVQQLKAVLDTYAIRPVVLLNPTVFPTRAKRRRSTKKLQSHIDADEKVLDFEKGLVKGYELLMNEARLDHVMMSFEDDDPVEIVIEAIAAAVKKFGRRACIEAPRPTKDPGEIGSSTKEEGQWSSSSEESLDSGTGLLETSTNEGLITSTSGESTGDGSHGDKSTEQPHGSGIGGTNSGTDSSIVPEEDTELVPTGSIEATNESTMEESMSEIVDASTEAEATPSPFVSTIPVVPDVNSSTTHPVTSSTIEQHSTTPLLDLTSMTSQYIRTTLPVTTINPHEMTTTMTFTDPTQPERTHTTRKTSTTKYESLPAVSTTMSIPQTTSNTLNTTVPPNDKTTTVVKSLPSDPSTTTSFSSLSTTSTLYTTTSTTDESSGSAIGIVAVGSASAVAASFALAAGLLASGVKIPQRPPVIDGGEPHSPVTELVASRDVSEPITPSVYA